MIEVSAEIIKLAKTVAEKDGKALLVGGSVRDGLLGIELKDYDLEVYGLRVEEIEEVAALFGKIKRAGKSFGVVKLITEQNLEIDISLPRRDSKTGPGHLGFDVEFDPHMSIDQASRRRDFTVNAILFDPLEEKIIDPFDGQKDLERKILRAVDPSTFPEDPLRALRAVQMAARFNMTIEQSTNELIKKMQPQLSELPTERIGEEWRKLLLKSIKPSIGLQYALEMGIMEALHPQFLALKDTPQNPQYHPEGNVWNHIKMVVDEAAGIIRREKLDSKESLIILYAALCHDLGKPQTTKMREGRWTSWGHAEAGVKPTYEFLKTQHIREQTQKKIANIVARHMDPLALFKQKAISDKNMRKLATRLDPATIYELMLVSEADRMGRGPFPDNFMVKENTEINQVVYEQAKKSGALNAKARPRLSGDELLQLGIDEGPEIKKAQEYAEKIYNPDKNIDEILNEIKKKFIE